MARPESEPEPAERGSRLVSPVSHYRFEPLLLSGLLLTVSPLDVTGWFWSGRVRVTPGPSVDLPVFVLVTPDLVWLPFAESEVLRVPAALSL